MQKSVTVSKAASYKLGAHHASPAIARAHVSLFAEGRASPEQLGVATLVVSELVTNAVMYGSEPIELDLTLDVDELRIEVSDADSDLAAVVPPDMSSSSGPSGRGLRIVEVLARQWGVCEAAVGKIVWATIELSSSRALG